MTDIVHTAKKTVKHRVALTVAMVVRGTVKGFIKTGGVMTEQENILHNSWRIMWLEQEKEKLYQEYIDKIVAINRSIEQLQRKTSNATLVTDYQ